MPMGKGTYGSKVGRPKKSLLTGKQKTLPDALRRRSWQQRLVRRMDRNALQRV